tara:strand:- start:10191 stop:10793 length:603 start_codon:yes stop_codon:yes gene_type:complete
MRDPRQFKRSYTTDGVETIWKYDLDVSRHSPVSVETLFPEAPATSDYVDINTMPQFSQELVGELRKISWAGPCVPIAISILTGENVVGLTRQCIKLGYSWSRRLTLTETRELGGWRGTAIKTEAEFSKLVEGDWIERHDLRGKTIHQIAKEAPKAKLYLENTSRSHAFAMVEGVLYDWSHKKRRKCRRVVELKPFIKQHS